MPLNLIIFIVYAIVVLKNIQPAHSQSHFSTKHPTHTLMNPLSNSPSKLSKMVFVDMFPWGDETPMLTFSFLISK